MFDSPIVYRSQQPSTFTPSYQAPQVGETDRKIVTAGDREIFAFDCMQDNTKTCDTVWRAVNETWQKTIQQVAIDGQVRVPTNNPGAD
jgi:hypothetical protein